MQAKGQILTEAEIDDEIRDLKNALLAKNEDEATEHFFTLTANVLKCLNRLARNSGP